MQHWYGERLNSEHLSFVAISSDPWVVVIHLVKNAVLWLNALPLHDTVSSIHSPQYLMTGQELKCDLHLHFHLKLGKYVQTHEEHTTSCMRELLVQFVWVPPETAKVDTGS